jgi:hypothetical protein
MNAILSILGIWFLISIPSSLILARLCALNKTRTEMSADHVQTVKPTTPISKEHQLSLT